MRKDLYDANIDEKVDVGIDTPEDKGLYEKSLEVLKYIENFSNKRFINVKYDNGDEAHYEYQTIKDLFPKEFNTLEATINDYLVYKQDYERVMKEKNSLLKEYAKSQKEHKALEIIVKKNVKIDILKYQSNVVFYNMAVFEKEEELTQEEFDLLKEVLL